MVITGICRFLNLKLNAVSSERGATAFSFIPGNLDTIVTKEFTVLGYAIW